MEDLKEKLESSFIVFENQMQGGAKGVIHKKRQEAFERFEALGFPTKRDEEYKYTNVKAHLKGDFRIFPNTETNLEYKDLKEYFVSDIDSYKVVFIDGVYSSWLSETTHDKFDICTFQAMVQKEPALVNKYFDTVLPKKESFSSLNTAFANEGAFIRVKKNQTVDKPIQILFFSTNHDKELMLQPRNLIIVEENAEVEIIERHQSLSDHAVFTNSATEIFAERSSRINYYKIQNDNNEASIVDNTSIAQYAHSNVRIGTFSFGNKFIRNNLNFFIKEEHTESHMDGISIAGDNQFIDHHTLADHKFANCYSDELYKGIYDGKGKGVFNGKVMVHPDAQKTNAFQQNNNILLTDTASIDTKPQLEIYADDVKCSHGCTIGQLDEDALFYLRSRGIGQKEAKALMLFAFANDSLRNVRIPALRKRLNAAIALKLGVNINFEL